MPQFVALRPLGGARMPAIVEMVPGAPPPPVSERVTVIELLPPSRLKEALVPCATRVAPLYSLTPSW
ncbi:hypothetical protein D3C86_1233930 [compost metagenome]